MDCIKHFVECHPENAAHKAGIAHEIILQVYIKRRGMLK
jgi:hypothetical protein